MDKSNQKSLNETIQNLNKVDAPKNITEGFFQSPEQKALNASLIQSIVEATFVEPIDESGKTRAERKRAAWQRNNRNIGAGREPSRSPSNGEVYDDVNKIHSKIALKALRPYRDSNERPLTKRERSILKQTETRNPGRAKTKASIGRYDERNALIIKGQENARFSRANATKGPHVARPSVSNPGTLSKEDSAEKRAYQAYKREAAAAELAKPRLPKLRKESFEPIDESGMAKGKRQIKSAHRKLKKPTPEIKGLLNPEVLVRSRRNNALGMLEKGINRINQSQVSRDFREKNESFEDIDESGEAKARREVESAHRKLKRPIPHYKGLVPEVIAGLAHKELALNTLDRGVRRFRGSMSSRELRNQNNESFEGKLKFAHIVKRLSKSALAARAAKIMARNEEFDGIAEEADETPKPKRVRKPKAAAPTPTPTPRSIPPPPPFTTPCSPSTPASAPSSASTAP